ncbi:MAG: response regulator [Leptospiraceae bacterium]|nr:response regulator [Leptospiraceae bacterium]
MIQAKKKILIVDDEPTNQLILNETLKNKHELLFADNGYQAIEIASQFLPDLILLDVMMPDITGYDVCKQLKANPLTQPIPIIFISAMSEVEDETKGFLLGAVDYIVKPVRPAVVEARVNTHLSLVRMEELSRTRLQIINSLGFAAEYKDNETGTHVIRMSHYSKILARSLGYAEEIVEEIFTAAPMHDIGKIGIPDFILRKPGKLDEAEWEEMKKHPLIGAEIIGEHTNGLLGMARRISISHHEKWDGSGYPYGLKGQGIPMEARIVAVADVFDALTTERPYKKPWTIEDACNFLKDQSGKHFDPDLIPLFLAKLPEILEIKERWK